MEARPVSAAGDPTISWLQGWPMAGHDPQHTNRSPTIGPFQPRLLVSRAHVYVNLIAWNGVMYGGVNRRSKFAPAQLDPTGRVLRTYHSASVRIALAPNGDTYASGADSGHVLAYSRHGKLLWKATTGLFKSAVPFVAPDNRLFAPFEGHPEDGSAGLDIFTPKGRRQRIEPGTSFFAAALGSDGNIFALTFDRGASWVRAINPSGTVLWQRSLTVSLETYGMCNCVMMGSDGTIFATDGKDLLALGPSGELLWRDHKPDGALALAERSDGILLVAGEKTLDALDPKGKLLWKASLNPSGQPAAVPRVISDAAGTAYVGTTDGRVHVINADGKQVAVVDGGGYHDGWSPALLLAPDGSLVVDSTDGILRIYSN
jgi:outer membrane protein assembly factor BamB